MPLNIKGDIWTYEPKDDPTDNNFRMGGDLWRVLAEDKKEILIQNTAGDIAPYTENIKYRHAAHCYLADTEYSECFTKAADLDLDTVKKACNAQQQRADLGNLESLTLPQGSSGYQRSPVSLSDKNKT